MSNFNFSCHQNKCFNAASWAAVGLVLTVGTPLFLRLPLWPDVTYFDVMSRLALRGDAPYRVIAEANLPGMLWLQMLIRSLGGWSDGVMRIADLCFVGTSIAFLIGWLKQLALPPRTCRFLIAAFCLFYFSTSEMCHAQRDVWALTPTLAALALRRRFITQSVLQKTESFARHSLAFIEGTLWASAAWIKPFVFVPFVCAWVVSVVHQYRNGYMRRTLFRELLVASGGLLTIFTGWLWLVETDNWRYFLENSRLWHDGYFGEKSPGVAFLYLSIWLFPVWGLLHFLAIPSAIRQFLPRTGSPQQIAIPDQTEKVVEQMLAAFYLGWTAQATLWQHGFQYHQVPSTMLAFAYMASRCRRVTFTGWHRMASTVALLAVLYVHPFMQPQRLALWWSCVSQPPTPSQTHNLQINYATHWEELDRVATFLQTQQLQDGDVLCSATSTISLHVRLGIAPASRFLMPDALMDCMPCVAQMFYADVRRGYYRFLIIDRRDFDFLANGSLAEDSRRSLQPATSAWRLANELPVAFATERYRVHQLLPTITPTPAANNDSTTNETNQNNL